MRAMSRPSSGTSHGSAWHDTDATDGARAAVVDGAGAADDGGVSLEEARRIARQELEAERSLVAMKRRIEADALLGGDGAGAAARNTAPAAVR